jgi:acyl-CoA hydrolase
MSTYDLPFPIDYIFVDTSYTDRLLAPEFRERLFMESHDLNVTPVFITQPTYLHGSGNIIPFNSTDTTPYAVLQSPVNTTSIRGIVAFQGEHLSDAFWILEMLRELDYCNLGELCGLKYFEVDGKKIVLMTVDSESG